MQNLFSAYRYQRLIRQLADWQEHVRLPAEAGEGRDRVQR